MEICNEKLSAAIDLSLSLPPNSISQNFTLSHLPPPTSSTSLNNVSPPQPQSFFCSPLPQISQTLSQITQTLSLSFSRNPKFANLSVRSSSSFNDPADPPSKPDASGSEKPAFVDEWGEKSEPEPEPTSKFSGSDPPKDEDEWGGSEVELGNGSPVADVGVNVGVKEDGDGKLWELKRALVDTVYGSDLGFRVSAEVRAEAFELVSQLEAANPTPAPTENPELLDGNWVLV
ncbi:UNVERIFIED_CONTAM: Plastoglobulin-1, chloroplastic [Sesamum calycinum]|uniref:Plastoglobulin-1, chloroplastic n=1 Tax=Sesamum calycinum TaxID=2727403 RepID=A0AAW2K0C5_9LAMI